MKIKKLLAVLLAALFVAGLLPLGGISLPAAKAEGNWPQITGFSVTDGFVYDKPSKPTVKAAVKDCTITQYDQKESCGVSGYDIVGEICLNVSEPVLCSDGSKADMPDQFVVRYGNWTIDSIKNADANEIDAAKPAIRNITTDKQENGKYSEAYNTSTFHTVYISDDEWEQYCYYRFKIVVDAEPTAAAWPQITDFSVTDGYLYDSAQEAKRTVACKVSDINIEQYEELKTIDGNNYAGCINIDVEYPVAMENGVPTTTSGALPTYLRMAKNGGYSFTATKNATLITSRNVSAQQSSTDTNKYTTTAAAMAVLMYDTNNNNAYIYYELNINVAEPTAAAWPQLVGFTVTDGYLYDNADKAASTVASKVKTVSITQYDETIDRDGHAFAGEVHITAERPVVVKDGSVTLQLAQAPENFYIGQKDYSGQTIKGTLLTEGMLSAARVAADGQDYKNEGYEAAIEIEYSGAKYYYALFITAEKANLTWPHLTGYDNTQPAYFYNSSIEANRTLACRINNVEVVNYTSLTQKNQNSRTYYIAGELHVTTDAPVEYANGQLTSVNVPVTRLLSIPTADFRAIASESDVTFGPSFGIEVSRVSANNTNLLQSSSMYFAWFHLIKDGKNYVYKVIVTIEEPNTAPALKEGVTSPAAAETEAGKLWSIDLSTIFEDADGDALSYTVSVNGAEAAATGGLFSMLPAVAGETTLVFTASDGKATSLEYTLTLTAKASGGTTPAVDWPQLTELIITDGHIYNEPTVAASTFACTVKSIDIVNYDSINMTEEGLTGVRVIGEVTIYVDSPVKVENGVLTDEAAEYPAYPDALRVPKKAYSGTVTGDNASLYIKNILYAQRVEGENYYKDGAPLPTLAVTANNVKYYYHLIIKPIEKPAEPTWPQLTGFSENDGYFYNGTTKRKKTIACKITDMDIINYDSLESVTLDSIDVDIAGEIAFKIDSPVKYDSTAGVTTEPDVYPARLLIPDETYSITATKDVTLDTTIVIAAETVSGSDVNLPTYKTASYYDLLRCTYEGKTYYYYLTITPNAATSTAPRIRDGIENPMKVQLEVGNVFTIDLDNVFVDDNGSALTYTVSVNGADAAATGSKYTFAPDKDGATDLVFKASNGQESEPFVVNIATSAVKYYAVSASAEGEYTVNSYKQSMGTAEVTVYGAKANEAKPGDTVTVTAVTQPCVLQSLLYDAKVDHWEATGVDLGAHINGQSVTFTMPENEVTLKAVLTKKGSVVDITANDFTGGELIFNVGSLSPSDNGTYENGAHVRDVMTDTLPAGVKISVKVHSRYNEGYKIDRWEIINTTTGQPVENVEYANRQYPNSTGKYDYPTFTVDGVSNYSVKAIFVAKDYADVNVVADAAQGTATAQAGANTGSTLAGVFEGTTVKLTAAANENYAMEKWEASYIAADGSTVAIEITNADKTEASFVMPATNRAAVTVKATFKKIKLSAECVMTEEPELLDANGKAIGVVSQSGTAYTITLPAGTDVSKLGEMKLKLSYSEFASVRKNGGEAVDWSVGIACGMKIDIPAKFTVVAEDGENTKDYTITIVLAKNGNNAITKVELLATADKAVIAEGVLDGSKWMLTITDKAVADNLTMQYLRLTYDEKATVAMAGGYGDATGDFKWRNGDVMCGMSVNQPVKFTVTAENGDVKEYTIEVKYDMPNAPELTNGSAERTSDKEATVKFTSGEAGMYYYAVVNKGATTPTVDTTKNGKNAVAGENVITLNNLTAGAREIYIIVKNASGVESAALKIDIPAFGGGTEQPGEFKITISAPKGGTLTASKTTAGAGDTITVTATPDAGMQLVAGSLTYTLAVAGGETKKIDNFTFTMPAGDVSLTCKWETKSTTVDGITGFSINGVSGSINQTNSTISVVMPYGTDVSKLVPVISGNNIASITPGSGVMQDFSKPVTYTVTLTDGTTKTYTVTVYVQSGTAADQMWGKLTDFYNQIPWWKYAEHQQSYGRYPRYW